MTAHLNADAWARFEAMIDAMQPGDVVTVADAVYDTGIGVESAQLMLDALTRADLFDHQGERFVRVRCIDALPPPHPSPL
jgi:hypothetical protein